MLLAVVLAAVFTGGLRAESIEPADPSTLARQPITAASGEVAKLLKQWHAAGTAAGNVGDVYDNRDRGHSSIRMQHFPQLSRIVYSEDELAKRVDWGAARSVRKPVLVGNSSTSAGVTNGGSNARQVYTNPRFFAGYFLQYVGSDLFVYPEHRDYDPGRHGLGGYGDLYPLNSPYLLISRGSSGSDRAFVNAAFWTLAALRPDVKQKLYENRRLMPTLQLIFRQCQKGIIGEADYLTGKAHPTAFAGKLVDPERMVRMAQGITADRLPPLSVLEVVDESESTLGVDRFHPAQSERFVTTPLVVSRIYRGVRPAYQITLSAEKSDDLNNRPLEYRWVVLRGDAEAIDIQPLNEAGSRVRITVPWRNEAMTAPDDPKIEHRRVDIGCFVHNGAYWSPPAFFSLLMPDDQLRTVDAQGRVIEIGYGAQRSPVGGPADISATGNDALVRDWPKFLSHLKSDNPKAAILRDALPAGDRRYLLGLAERLAAADAELAERRDLMRQINEQIKKAEKNDKAQAERLKKLRNEARRQINEADDQVNKLVTATDATDGRSAKQIVEQMYATIRQDMRFYLDRQAELDKLSHRIRQEAARLGSLRVFAPWDDGWILNPLHDGDAPVLERLSDYQRDQIGRLHDTVIHALADGTTWSPRPNYVDPRVILPADWRDVYQYDEQGNLTGWTRYAPGHAQPLRFNADGKLITDDGPAVVRYQPTGKFPRVELKMVLPGSDTND